MPIDFTIIERANTQTYLNKKKKRVIMNGRGQINLQFAFAYKKRRNSFINPIPNVFVCAQTRITTTTNTLKPTINKNVQYFVNSPHLYH